MEVITASALQCALKVRCVPSREGCTNPVVKLVVDLSLMEGQLVGVL